MANYDPRREIVIFSGGKDGYGDAKKHADRDSYSWAVNWDNTEEGRSVPALAPIKYTTGSLLSLRRIATVFEWEDATTLRPFLLASTGGAATSVTIKLVDGTYAGETSDGTDSLPILSAVLFRHDGSTADNEMAYFARGTIPGTTALLLQRTKAADYTDTTPHTVSPYGIYVVSSDLWIVSPNGYEVQKWALDTDPGLSGSYQTPIPVGRPTYPINFIANLGGSPLVIKGDGIFKYDPSPSVAQFINVTPFISPHKENGIGTNQDGRGRVYVPSVDGHLVVVTSGFQSLQTPARNRLIDRDTPYGRITAVTCDLEKVYAAVEPGQKHTNQLGLTVVIHETGAGSETAKTTECTDGQFATIADISLFGNTDIVYVGADEPFLGAYFTMNTVSTNALVSLGISYSSAANTFTSAANSHDSTSGFHKDGLITVQASDNRDLFTTTSTPWVKTTAYAGSAEKYWMKILLSMAAGASGAKIAEVRVVPYRPPLDTSLFPETAYAIGGALPAILVGHWHGEEIVWNHVWTLDSSRIEAMIVGSGYCGALPTKRGLYCFDASLNVFAIPVGPDANGPWPKLADYSESTVAYDTHAIGFSAIDFGQVVSFTSGLEIDMTAVQSDDTVAVYAKWDEDYTRGYQKLADHKGRKHFFTRPPQGMGRILYTYLQYSDGSRTAMAPVLHSVTIPPASWAPVPDFELQEANIPSPQQS